MHNPPGSLPQVTVIVPVAGAAVDLEKYLQSLLQQEYPDFTVIFVTQDEDDPAVPLIEKVIAGPKRGRRITAGKALGCSQKNYNLVAGVRAADPATDILVFCDCGHYAHPRWLERVILPLQDPLVTVSSGYHHVFPEEDVCSTGRAICVLGLYMARQIPAFAQPWGGSTAIRAEDFHELAIADLWLATVVDDVTLADHLQKMKRRTAVPTEADVKTFIHDCSWRAWETWLVRQWAYLKFVFPQLWLFTGIAGIAFTLWVLFCMVIVLAWGLEIFPESWENGAAVFLAAIALSAGMLRLRHPAPGSLLLWYPAFVAALIMAGWCHARTWFSDAITWAGIVYKVAAGGKVVAIIRPKTSNQQEMIK